MRCSPRQRALVTGSSRNDRNAFMIQQSLPVLRAGTAEGNAAVFYGRQFRVFIHLCKCSCSQCPLTASPCRVTEIGPKMEGNVLQPLLLGRAVRLAPTRVVLSVAGVVGRRGHRGCPAGGAAGGGPHHRVPCTGGARRAVDPRCRRHRRARRSGRRRDRRTAGRLSGSTAAIWAAQFVGRPTGSAGRHGDDQRVLPTFTGYSGP